MKLVILESPYAGDVKRNIQYAKRCVKDSLLKGEAPIASHLLYTQKGILNDDIPEERQLGINAGLAWKTVAEATVVYADFGITIGMQYGIDQAEKQGLEIEIRYLFKRRIKMSIDPMENDLDYPSINKRRKDNRYVIELPSGIIKNPQIHNAGDDFNVNDAVWLDGNTVKPIYDKTKNLYGIIAAKGKKGKTVLVAAK